MDPRLQAAHYFWRKNDWNSAEKALHAYLNDNPGDLDPIFHMAGVCIAKNQIGLAHYLYHTLGLMGMESPDLTLNRAKTKDMLHQHDEAEATYLEVLERDPGNIHALRGLCTTYVSQYRPEDAVKWADRLLMLYPEHENAVAQAHTCKGFAYLQQRDYARGWEEFDHGAGHLLWRDKKEYGGKPQWDGTRGQRLIVYSDQGLGDQIAGVEPLRDAMRDNEVLLMACDPKVRRLFHRSFGIRLLDTEWDEFHPKPEHDANCGFYKLHQHYRRSEADYPKTPYLKADPLRQVAMRALLDVLGPEPKVGLAWSGGVSLTQSAARHAPLDAWLPILRQPAHFVSLEYRDRRDEHADIEQRKGIRIHDFPWATRTGDLDDLAPLVAELDLIIAVPTTVVHLAGALGVPCLCLTHPRPNYHYGREGSQMPYYGSVQLIRRSADHDWVESVNRAAELLLSLCAVRRQAA